MGGPCSLYKNLMNFRVVHKYVPQVTVSSRQLTCIHHITSIEKKGIISSGKLSVRIFPKISVPVLNCCVLNQQRCYAKKGKVSKQTVEDEDSDSEEEDIEADEVEDGEHSVKRTVPSLRLDTIIKAGLGITKKKVEKEFYACNVRVNGEKAIKKATTVYLGDELDLVKGISPDNERFLLVDRIVVKAIGKPTGTGNFPVQMQVFKSLTVENYSDSWVKSSSDRPIND